MNVSELFDPHCVSFDQVLETKEAVFNYLVAQLREADIIDSVDHFLKALYYRESLSETGLGEGIAIPHGKDSSVKKASIAFVRLAHPIPWESLDDGDVQYIFLLAIPEGGQDNQHIKMISELARSLIRPEVIEKVKHASQSADLMKVL